MVHMSYVNKILNNSRVADVVFYAATVLMCVIWFILDKFVDFGVPSLLKISIAVIFSLSLIWHSLASLYNLLLLLVLFLL